MTRRASALALVALAGAVVLPTGGEARGSNRRLPPGTGTANPSALVANEIAFARMAHEKGQWTAFRAFADDDGVMFVPQPVLAKEWLRGRADPAVPVQWQAHQVWMSCDGTLGVTKGAWQGANGKAGYFTTIWKQQKKGTYRWVLDQGDTLAAPLPNPEMLSASVADCAGQSPRDLPEGSIVVEGKAVGPKGSGRSDDGTLAWAYNVAPDNGRTLSVSLRRDGQMQQVLSLNVAGG